MRRILVFQHSDDLPLGIMAPLLDEAGAVVELIHGEHGCTIPADAGDAAGMIMLGGVMSANDDARLPAFSRASAADP